MRLLHLCPWTGILALATGACTKPSPAGGDAGPAPSALSSAKTAESARPGERLPAPVREGGAIVRSPEGHALYVADEDHRAVRVVLLPLGSDAPATDGGAPPLPAM